MLPAADNPEKLREAWCRQYLANLEALYRTDAPLAAALDHLPLAELPPLEPTRDGHLTLKLTADDGRPVYAHSRHRPLEEARRIVEQLPEREHPTFFINGLGLGYLLPELEQRFGAPVLIVAEDDLRQIKLTLGLHDLRPLIESRRLLLLTAAERGHVHGRLEEHTALILLGFRFVTAPHTRRYHAAFHEQIRRLMTDFVSYARTQMVTLLRTSRVTFENVVLNLPAYLDNPGIEVLAGAARGCPAIVVAAGPSLARNLDLLSELQDRAVIIAVQTILRLLYQRGICPHFVTSLDFHEVSTEFFRGIADFGRCTLVAEPKAAWRVIDMYGGPKRLLAHQHHRTLLRQADPQRGGLKAGSTVAHLAFYLAQHLGCDPIVFVGQDLAFSEGMFYIPGSPIEQIWACELGRFCTIEMKQWERIVRNRPILRRTTDLHGRAVYSDDLLCTYRDQFESDLAASPQRVIQASEGGVALAGADVAPLAEVAERYCRRKLPPELLSPERRVHPDPAARQAAREALQQRIEEIQEILRIARETRQLLDRLERLVERPAEFNRLIARVDELRTLIRRYPEVYRLVLDVSATAVLRRYSADRRMAGCGRSDAATARRRLAADREFVDAFIDGCEFLLRVLPRGLRRLDGAGS